MSVIALTAQIVAQADLRNPPSSEAPVTFGWTTENEGVLALLVPSALPDLETLRLLAQSQNRIELLERAVRCPSCNPLPATATGA